MKSLALALTLGILLTPAAHTAGGRRGQLCPVVNVSCIDSAPSGAPATFTANVSGLDPGSSPTFKWTVSAGAIQSGQATSSMVVDTTGLPGNSTLTATVEVGGLPELCDASASCSTAIPSIIKCGRPLDEYGNISFEDEQARLDNFAIELQNDPTSTGYIQCYGGRVGYEGEALRRCDRAKRYISNVRGISADRIATEDGGFKEDLTVAVWVVPRGATPPQATPTVDPSEATVLKPKAARKSRKR